MFENILNIWIYNHVYVIFVQLKLYLTVFFIHFHHLKLYNVWWWNLKSKSLEYAYPSYIWNVFPRDYVSVWTFVLYPLAIYRTSKAVYTIFIAALSNENLGIFLLPRSVRPSVSYDLLSQTVLSSYKPENWTLGVCFGVSFCFVKMFLLFASTCSGFRCYQNSDVYFSIRSVCVRGGGFQSITCN